MGLLNDVLSILVNEDNEETTRKMDDENQDQYQDLLQLDCQFPINKTYYQHAGGQAIVIILLYNASIKLNEIIA